jgi:hypothetical protein
MIYSWDKFLRPLASGDTTIQVVDNNGNVTYSINPYSIIKVFINQNQVVVGLKGNKNIIIPFSNINESKLALPRIQQMILSLQKNPPLFVNKETEQYVQNFFQKSVGVVSLNGSTESNQSFISNNDENIGLNINRNGGTHSFILNWTGILPIERGGLGNKDFQDGEFLISSTGSIVSSGWSINDIIEKVSSKKVYNVGDGVSTNFQLNHNLGTRDVIVQIYETSTGDSVETFVRRLNDDDVEIFFNKPPSEEEYRVIIS